MIIAIASLLVVMAISLLTMRLAAMALILTGMSRESARFQARSALAGVGFTTKEAEMVVNHPVRRRIIMVLMLIGSIGVPTVVASIVISFVTTAQAEYWWKPMSLLVGGLGVLALLSRSRWAEKRINRWLAWILKRWTNLDVRDYVFPASVAERLRRYGNAGKIQRLAGRKNPSGSGTFPRRSLNSGYFTS